MEPTTETPFCITVCPNGLNGPVGKRAQLVNTWDGCAATLHALTGGPWWWSPHTWTGDHRGAERWEAAACIALDLDFHDTWSVTQGKARPQKGHPSAGHVDRFDTALMELPAVLGNGSMLAHHTPRGARLVLLLDAPITDRDLYARAVRGAAELVTRWLEAGELLEVAGAAGGAVDGAPLARPGYEVDPAGFDLARVLWAPRATTPSEKEPRRGTIRGYGDTSRRFAALQLAAFAPANVVAPAPSMPLPPLANWPAVEAALLRSPGARAGAGKVAVRCPFHGPDNAPSAAVFESGVLVCLASGCDANKGRPLERWAATPGGAALLGADFARALTAEPVGRVRGETLRPFWRTVGEWSADEGDWLDVAPPPMDWLLTVPETSSHPERRHVLPRGTVGMLAAGGGVGKSMALLQLAVAVATETPWLAGRTEGAFPALLTHATAGERVLLALGEENALKARRRLWTATRHLTPAEMDQLRDRLVIVPLEAVPVGLMADRNARGGEEARGGYTADELALLLNEGGPWALVVLDPLSRFAGMETETDNAAATRFVQVLERFTKAPGAPTVMVSHHTGQAARREGMHDATAARGATALTDGVRWVATLTKETPPEGVDPRGVQLLKMAVTKNNYGMELRPFWLSRGDGGVLRCATAGEVETFTGKGPKARTETKATRGAWGGDL